MKQISANITGSLILNGVDVTDLTISSSVWSGSLSTRVSNLESFSGSINSYTASNNTNISNLNATTSSLNSYTGSNNTNISNLNATSASLNLASGSAITRLNAIEVVTGSNISRLNSIESTTGSLNTASGSAITRLNALEVTSGSNITRISALESASGSAITRLNSIESTTGSLNAASGSAISRLNSIESTTGSLNAASGSAILRLSALEVTSGSNISRLSSLESKTGSYATTGSNIFVDGQYISQSSNPTGFTTTASLYTDGGLRVSRDAYISGTLYLNNVTVYGTQSVCFITSSQLNISSNIISVNTATPSVRFGGLSVYDSGSTGLTGSILWDSQDNQWIYSNPSGSEYDSAMFLVGPRNSGALGSEVGIGCNFLSKGNGLHHMTSSGIFEDGSRTCFYGNTVVSSSGTVCTTMANASCIGVNTTTPFKRLTIDASDVASDGIAVRGNSSPAYIICETSGVGSVFSNDNAASYIGTNTNHPFNVRTNSQIRLAFSSAGIACFACQVCSPVSIITGCASIGSFSAPSSTLDITRSSPDPFNTVQCQLSLKNDGGNGGAGSQLNFIIGSAAPFIRGLVDGANSNSGAALVFGTACFNGAGVERFRITSTGISCFACRVCAPVITAGAGTSSQAIKITGDDNYIEFDNVGTYIKGGGNLTAAATSTLFLSTSASTRLTIASTGIATFACQVCAPGAVIGGQISVNAGNGNQLYLNNSGQRYTQITFDNNSSGATKGGLWWDNTTCFFEMYSSFTGGLKFYTSGDLTNSKFTITSTGIACFACQVCTPQLSVSAGTDLMATFNSTTNNPYIRFGHSGAYQFYIGESNVVGGGGFCGYDIYANCGLRFYAGALERIRITPAGLVGINTTNYGERLNIGCGGAIAFQNTCNCQKWHIQYRGTEDGLNFVESAVADFRLFLKAGGNVGIGVNPNYKLEVSGNACFTGGVAIGGSYCAFALNVHGVTYQIGGSTWVQNGYGYVNAGATTTGLFPQSDSTIQLRVGNASALTISSNQISCFSNTVCTPGIYVGTNQENTILSSSRIHLNTCVQRFYTINHWQLANGSFSCTVTDPAATYGCAKVMPLGGSSTYFFGPYSYLTPGSYVAKFRMKVDNNSSTSALFTLDTNRGGGVQIAPSTFCTSGCYQYINIPFTISSPSDVFEARGLSYNSGITCAYLDHVLIEAAENPGQYFSKDNFRLYAGNFNCARLNINTDGSMIFNCNGTYCSNYGYNFLCALNGTMLSGPHTMGNMGAGTQCATPLWCSSGALRMEFNWASGGYINWLNHNNCTPMLLQWSADNQATKHCFDYVGNACHCGIVIARGYQGAGFSTLSAGSGTSVGSFDTITRSGVGLYEVAIVANPNAGGSDYYDFWYGRLLIGRGYSGAAVTDYLVWCQESTQPRSLYPSGGGNLTVTACMFQSGVESTCIGRDGSYTIRFKISGYNSSYTGAGTTIFMKLII